MMARLAALVTLLALLAPVGARAGETIVIEATRVVPDFLETMTGTRVDFVNRAQRSVHVEFGVDPRQHQVVQVPATGPIWAVFHRPGTHPYVVHVYDGRTIRTLQRGRRGRGRRDAQMGLADLRAQSSWRPALSPDSRTVSPPPDARSRQHQPLVHRAPLHRHRLLPGRDAILSVLVIWKQMPRRMMPYVESPMVGIVSMMPGLSAEEMEIYFSKPIEERMVDLKNVHFVRSTSQEGFSIVSVEFWYGTDMKKALFDVQSLMNVVQADLPMTGANLKPSWVLAIDPLNIPVLSLAVTGEGYDPVQLRTLVENEVVNRLKVVKDVYSIVLFGGQKLQMQVIVDRDRLAAYKMSLLDLKNMLDMQNQSRPAGTLTFQDREVLVRSDFRARTPEEVAAYPIASMDGRTVYLQDVAEVVNAPREQRSLYRFNGKEAVELSIIQQPEASSVRVIEGVKAKLKEIQEDFPRLEFEVAYDNSTFVGFLMDNMVEELVIAVLLTGLVVLLFLGNVRGTLISVITIPISLGMALLAMVPFGHDAQQLDAHRPAALHRAPGGRLHHRHPLHRAPPAHGQVAQGRRRGRHQRGAAGRPGHHLHGLRGAPAAGLLGRHRPVHVRGHRLADHLRAARLGARLVHADRAAGRQPVPAARRRRRPRRGRGSSAGSWIRASGSSSGWRPGTGRASAWAIRNRFIVLCRRDWRSSSSASRSTRRSAAR